MYETEIKMEEKMKKLLLVLTVCVFAIAMFSACGTSDTTDTSTDGVISDGDVGNNGSEDGIIDSSNANSSSQSDLDSDFNERMDDGLSDDRDNVGNDIENDLDNAGKDMKNGIDNADRNIENDLDNANDRVFGNDGINEPSYNGNMSNGNR